jgi:hypothetical protein
VIRLIPARPTFFVLATLLGLGTEAIAQDTARGFDLFQNTFECASCHGAAAEGGLGPTLAGTRLLIDDVRRQVRAPSSSQQPGLQRVLPGNPDDSYLVRKLEGGPGITGARMPLSRASLPTAQLDLIRLWIAQGASARHVQQ